MLSASLSAARIEIGLLVELIAPQTTSTNFLRHPDSRARTRILFSHGPSQDH